MLAPPQKPGKKAKLGTGKRFKSLSSKLSKQKGVYDPNALAAWLGRKAHGAKKMGRWAAKGRAKKRK